MMTAVRLWRPGCFNFMALTRSQGSGRNRTYYDFSWTSAGLGEITMDLLIIAVNGARDMKRTPRFGQRSRTITTIRPGY